MTAVCLFLAVVMTVVTVRVKRLVWDTDKIIPLMLVAMSCTLYTLALFFVWYNIFDSTFWLEQTCASNPSTTFAVLNVYLKWLPCYFLGVGAMLNLNKWCYFLMRIWVFVRIGRQMH